MEKSVYSNMQARLATIRMSGHDRAQAERNMRRAAMLVETLLGGMGGKSSNDDKSERAA